VQASASKTMTPFEWFLLLILSMLWGGSFFFSKVAVAELRPFTLVLGRVAIAATALHLIVLARGQRLPTSLRTWGSFAVMAVLNNVIPFSLIFWGQTQIPSGLASVLNATTPLWTVLLAHYLTHDERLTSQRLAGVLIGLGGAAIVIGPDALRGLTLNVLAQLAVVGAGVAYALAGIYGKRFTGIEPAVVAAGQVTCTALMMVPLVAWVDRPWLSPMPGATTWAALLGLGLLSTATAYLIYFRLLASAGATNVLLVTMLVPVSALLLGVAVLGERFELRHLAGMALVALGLMAIDGRPLASVRSRLTRLAAK
jgi:drug/metabolite transporter (DMT)-like permease